MPALILLSYASLLILSLLDNVRGPYYPEVLFDFGVNGTIGAWFFAMTSLFAFIGSSTSHWLLDRWSCFTLLSVAGAVLGFGFALIGLSPTFTHLLPSAALFGWAYGALNVAQNVMVYECSPPNLRRRFFSGLHAMYGLSALLAPLTATAFRWMGFDWRQAFLVMATLPAFVSAVSFLVLKAPPKVDGKVARVSFTGQDWNRTGLFVLMMAGYLWGELSISTRLVIWLRSDREFTADLADFYLAGFFLTLFAGRLFFSFVHFPRVGNWTILYVSAFLGAICYYLGLNGSAWWLIVCGAALSPFFPVAMEQISASFGGKGSQGLGLVIGCGSGSVVLMHLTIGWLSDRVGLTRALHLGPLTLLSIALALFAIHGVRRKPA